MQNNERTLGNWETLTGKLSLMPSIYLFSFVLFLSIFFAPTVGGLFASPQTSSPKLFISAKEPLKLQGGQNTMYF